ncbi:MAG: hypothetical protein V4670_00110 [Bacteroidota bacterium]
MKKSFALFVYLLFLSIGSYAQRPAAPIKTPKANENTKINPILITDKSKVKVIDTTYVKIKDLQQKNQVLSQELKDLKAYVNNSLVVLKKTAPIAYASFEITGNSKEIDGNVVSDYKLASQYGIEGISSQSFRTVVITLNQNIVGIPAIVTAAGNNLPNYNSSKESSTLNYQFIAPNKIRLTIYGTGFIPAFSIAVYGTAE